MFFVSYFCQIHNFNFKSCHSLNPNEGPIWKDIKALFGIDYFNKFLTFYEKMYKKIERVI